MKYAVVIPHYNSPGTLKRLVNSIPERTDIEVIIVDDVSNAECIKEIRGDSILNTRARVIYSEEKLFGGGARNMGLTVASAEWVLFADADDYYDDSAFEHLDAAIDEHRDQVDVFYFKAQGFDEATAAPTQRADRYNQLIDNYQNYSRFDNVVPWNKIIRRNIIVEHSLQFDLSQHANDVLFSARLGFATSRIGLIDHVSYFVQDGVGSLTKAKSEDATFSRRKSQLKQESLLFENLPQEFINQRRFLFYRKYLRDSEYFLFSRRLRLLRRKYEECAQIHRINRFRISYHTGHMSKRIVTKLRGVFGF